MTTALTARDVADFCRVTYSTVIKWIKSGKLKACELPGELKRIRKEDFVEFLERHDLPLPPELMEETQRRLLIVDDNTAIVDLLEELLGDIEGLEIETAPNGYEAGLRMTTFKPHMIILDLWMPGINGFEVCRHLKYNPETSGIKILAITGYPCERSIEKISDIGADVLLTKPLDTELLKDTVERMVRREETAETRPAQLKSP